MTDSLFTVRAAPTDDLPADVLAAARALLDAAFDGDFDDFDWRHCQGGVHVLGWEDGTLVAHAAVVPRSLRIGERWFATGYIEGVAVREDRRGSGYGNAVMDTVEAIVRARYELGALSATDVAAGWYRSRGWIQWNGPSYVWTDAGPRRTEGEEEAIHVLPSATLDAPIDPLPIACDDRDGEVW